MVNRKTLAAATISALVAAGLAMPASAQTAISSYTDIDLDQCSVFSSDDFGSTWACPGYKGIPVMVSEGDLRFYVSYGLTSTEEKAAHQTLPPFNSLGSSIEWRIGNVDGQIAPYATILRYKLDKGESDKEGQVLVVTRLGKGETCHVAYIDALANADANDMARKAADEMARDFDCENEPKTIGAFSAY